MAEGRSETPSHGLGVAPDNKTLWVTSVFANAVFVYSLPELKLLGHVALPELKLTGRAASGARPNSAIRSVSAIDTKAMKVVANIPVGEVPKRINTLALR